MLISSKILHLRIRDHQPFFFQPELRVVEPTLQGWMPEAGADEKIQALHGDLRSWEQHNTLWKTYQKNMENHNF